jgi:hypothetical protein
VSDTNDVNDMFDQAKNCALDAVRDGADAATIHERLGDNQLELEYALLQLFDELRYADCIELIELGAPAATLVDLARNAGQNELAEQAEQAERRRWIQLYRDDPEAWYAQRSSIINVFTAVGIPAEHLESDLARLGYGLDIAHAAAH